MSVKVEVWGEYACFSRTELKVERVSYDVMTPSAARGLLEAIYWHPGMKWNIDRIYVLSPIKMTSIRRNEVQSKVLASNVRAAMAGGKNPLYISTSRDIVQRSSLVLQDVHYVIEAHFTMTEKAAECDNHGKFQDIMKRRLHRGQCFHQPYMGCREFPARFREWEGGEIPAIEETRELGYMLWDLDFSDMANIQPLFFRAKMVKGVLDLTDCEVVR
ncbi:CRISPR pre-crRNA endoribonuclease Cas5d [Lachnospiraceae bacterium]|nr:CRISPR pre-crRNA endoribonuclease Cas5d [Lachnospiraceae bacterium]